MLNFKIFPTIPDVPYKAENGDDGTSVFITRQVDDVSSITIYFSDGTTVIVPKGIDGTDGDDGVGIVSILRTSGTGAAGSLDTYTITFTDTTATTFTVQNGTNGNNGSDGIYVTTATVVQDPLNANYRKLLVTLSNSAVIDCGIAKGTDGINVVSFTVNVSGDVSATMSDASVLSVGNIYGGIALIQAEVIGDDLMLTYPNGTFNAGNVRGPIGATGPAGSAYTLIDNDSEDLNNRTTTNEYYITDITVCANAPTGLSVQEAFLSVKASGARVKQELTIYSGVIYTRMFIADWTGWYSYTGTGV
jgi:hypothetical protein